MAIDRYKQCINCGKYFLVSEDNPKSIYCSAECRAMYSQCIVCGEYYKLTDKNYKHFCGDKCRAIYGVRKKKKKKKREKSEEKKTFEN